jgi:hypothetical protein
MANTILFAGGCGFLVKLWMVDRDTNDWAGLYSWDTADTAERYGTYITTIVRPLSVEGSVGFEVRADLEPVHRRRSGPNGPTGWHRLGSPCKGEAADACGQEVNRMLHLESSVLVDGITGREITEFLLSPTDERYRAWWPGTHLQFHVVASRPDHVGDVVWMDEYVGSRRLRMTGVVVEAEPGRTIVWQLKRWVRLPAVLRLDLVDQGGGCLVRHRTQVGSRGIGRIFDPLLRLYVSPRFAAELDEHVRTEFPRLRDLLRNAPAA